MKRCLLCGCIDDSGLEKTCVLCGEATWSQEMKAAAHVVAAAPDEAVAEPEAALVEAPSPRRRGRPRKIDSDAK